MSENDAGGQTRIDAAKQAATTLIEDISDSTDLGFTYYGGNTSEDMAAYERGCQDVSVVRGPERGNSEELTTAIAALEPGGFTPIGKALIDSADELPEGDNIVLVSDGLANCTPPDICEVATDLSDSGVNLVINAIGFNVDLQARSELECIAESGGGIYADASDADSLIDALKRATTRQYVAYDSAVQDIQGSEAIDAAPEVPRNVSEFSTKIPPAADPHDSGSGGTSLYWRIPVEKGESLSIASNTVVEPTVVTYDPGTLYLTPRLHENADSQTPSGNRCSTYIDSLGENNFRGIQSVSLVSEKIGTPNCDTSEVILEIERRGDYRDGADLLSEITIRRFGEVDPPVFAALGGGAADATAETTPQPVDSTTLEAAGTEESNNGLSYALGGLGVVVLLGIIAAIIFISHKYNGNQWTRPRGRFQYRPR